MSGQLCEECQYFGYDEEYDEYICTMNMLDEDDYYRMLTDKHTQCPYYRRGDEYSIVRKQM